MQLSRKISTFDSLSICPTRQSRTRIQVLRPGRRLSRTTRPPTSRVASASITSQPRSPRVLAASGPAGPAPTTTTRSCRALEVRGTRSGGQPRRCSLPTDGFRVQRIGTPSGLPFARHFRTIIAEFAGCLLFRRSGPTLSGSVANKWRAVGHGNVCSHAVPCRRDGCIRSHCFRVFGDEAGCSRYPF